MWESVVMTVAEFVALLGEVPPDWDIYATQSGRSVEVRAPDGSRYAYVFTDGTPTLWRRAHRRR